uniref:WGS project CBMI000000000 data, contig CS3069_c002194 n=1 Tax=Fusarium clavum TaxID=2594811 RepID=A0A090MIM6_9HYPO|nr:unnamed protein product [Fusarium clavum]
MSSTPNLSPEKTDAAGSAVVGLELTLKVQRICRSAASSAIIPGTIAKPRLGFWKNTNPNRLLQLPYQGTSLLNPSEYSGDGDNIHGR